MARKVSPAMEPFIALQKSLPHGTPFPERARLAKELKARLAAGGGRRRNPVASQAARRRNPGGSGLLLPLALAGGAWYLWKHHGHAATATATAPGPMATPTATSVGL